MHIKFLQLASSSLPGEKVVKNTCLWLQSLLKKNPIATARLHHFIEKVFRRQKACFSPGFTYHMFSSLIAEKGRIILHSSSPAVLYSLHHHVCFLIIICLLLWCLLCFSLFDTVLPWFLALVKWHGNSLCWCPSSQVVLWHYTKKSSHAFSWPFFSFVLKRKTMLTLRKRLKKHWRERVVELLKMQRMFKIAKQSKIYKKLNQRILTTKPTPDDLKSKKAVFITFSPKKYKSPNFVYATIQQDLITFGKGF